jgi:hypothetical protein
MMCESRSASARIRVVSDRTGGVAISVFNALS